MTETGQVVTRKDMGDTLSVKQKIKIENISLSFGSVMALENVSLDVNEGELLAIIGPNGSGKTCLLNCISGYYHPNRGNIFLDGQSLLGLPVHKRTLLGPIGRTFQNIELFPGLSALETILAARGTFFRSGILSCAFYFGLAHDEEIKQRRIVEEIIDFLDLQSVRNMPIGALSFGWRRKVALGVALALEPAVLLLDEPLAGMNLQEKEDVVRFILDIHEGGEFGYKSKFLNKGIGTIVLVEHDMGVVMDVAERIVVLDFGRKIAEGGPAEIGKDSKVIKAYLGQEF